MICELYLNKAIFFFLFKKYLFIYVFGSPGLSCGMWDLCCHVRDLFSCGMRALVPGQGSNTGPLQWECGVPTAGPPGKFQIYFFS